MNVLFVFGWEKVCLLRWSLVWVLYVFYFIFLFCCYFYVFVNRSFFRFRSNIPDHVFYYLYIVFVVFKVSVCMLGQGGRETVEFDPDLLQQHTRVLTTGLSWPVKDGVCRDFKHFFI